MSHDLLSACRVITRDQTRELTPLKLSGIYALADPVQPYVVRYVGSSTNLASRLARHCTGYMPKDSDGPKRAWLAQLRRDGRYPVMYWLQEMRAAQASKEMHAAERQWIERFRAQEMADLNATLIAGERKFLRVQLEEAKAEIARLRAIICMQRATSMQRCTCCISAQQRKVQRNTPRPYRARCALHVAGGRCGQSEHESAKNCGPAGQGGAE